MTGTPSAPNQPLPRPFSFHWGSGQIVEEATFAGEWSQPAVQLLEYEDGALSIRFCSYNHRGMFQRNPMMLAGTELAELRAALSGCPRLRALLTELVS